MTLAHDLSLSLLDAVRDRLRLEEVQGADGGPYLTLSGPIPGVPPGRCRVFKGEKVPLMVYVGAALPMAHLDSHMLFAFTGKDSLVPHFTLDAIKMGEQFAFHLDLIPKVDLGSNLEYLNAAFQPLTGVYTEACAIEGLSPAELSPRQKALMSPWMLAHRATEQAFRSIQGPVEKYFGHWAALLDAGLPQEVVGATHTDDLGDRDTRNRAALFNPEVDPVWEKMTPMIGAENCALLQALLKGETNV